MDYFPTISIIVPNYNGGATIAGTLQSLIDQNYPALEIIVMDGGSKDDSVEVIKRFESHLTYWTSERDKGQTNAINNGFERSTGEILNWLCSDDLLEPGCLHHVAEMFQRNPMANVVLGGGVFVAVMQGNALSYSNSAKSAVDALPFGITIAQPSCFYRRKVLRSSRPLDESLHYAMDFDLWCQFREDKAVWVHTDRTLSRALVDGNNKTSTGRDKIAAEMERIIRHYAPGRLPFVYWYRRIGYPIDLWRAGRTTITRRYLGKAAKAVFQAVFIPFYGRQQVRTVNWSAYV